MPMFLLLDAALDEIYLQRKNVPELMIDILEIERL